MQFVKIQKIKSVKPIGECSTVDLEVDHKDHNFYCEGFVTSNSHSISYANLAAITMYLKFNYPQEFFLSLLKYAQFEPETHDEIHKITQELSMFDIKLLPPDLVHSDIDFKIEGNNIRYGLNTIKGVSTNVLESLLEFREGKFENKYEVFIAAKQAGVNIGVLSALIQAGVLDTFVTKDRCRLVLEAQTFNILTDREKRNFITIGKDFEYDILNSIQACVKDNMIGDDNKRIFTEKRFVTFKTKYNPYKEIYERNKKHIKFANWHFESKLLGYSYSQNIRDIFKYEIGEVFSCASAVVDQERDGTVRFVGTVSDVVSRTSANGNKYARIEMGDETGNITALIIDTNRGAKYSEYLRQGNVLPKKGGIAIIIGKKTGDVVMIDKLTLLEDKIYMKLSEVK